LGILRFPILVTWMKFGGTKGEGLLNGMNDFLGDSGGDWKGER
jgi:hypothetical protein